MTNIFCPRCQSSFYTAITAGKLSCPYCGFQFSTVEAESRSEVRAAIERLCSIVAGDRPLPARTMDISRAGVCVSIASKAGIAKEDRVHVRVDDFDLDTEARVVWVRRIDDNTSAAGLEFCRD